MKISSLIQIAIGLIQVTLREALVHTISSFQGLAPFSPKRDLVIWDLDHTLIEPKTYRGSEPWFEQQYHSASDPAARHQVILQTIDLNAQLEFRLTELGLKERWAGWQREGIELLGMTSRSPLVADKTHLDLESLGIAFEPRLLEEAHFERDLLRKGIFFTAGGSKAHVLERILETHPKYQERSIVFIDDTWRHVEAIDAYLEAKGQKGRVYHYTSSRERYKCHEGEEGEVVEHGKGVRIVNS